jgi:hypothetical protein
VVEKDFLRRILYLRRIKIQESNESSEALQFAFSVRYQKGDKVKEDDAGRMRRRCIQ